MDRIEKSKAGFSVPKVMEGRRILFRMSDELPDRSGDVVKVDGWDLANFMANPVFPPMHAVDRYPLGKWEKVWADGGSLWGIVQFADEGTHPEADLAYSLYKQGIMNAVSVRFLSDAYEPNDNGGMTFTGQELVECSAVPVPDNPRALAVAKEYPEEARKAVMGGSNKAVGVQTNGESPEMEGAPDLNLGKPITHILGILERANRLLEG